MKIIIKIGEINIEAELNDSSTAKKIADALPIEAEFQTWGDEIYFTILVDDQLNETATNHVAVGDLGFWPSGSAFCIFFGPTPMSKDSDPVPASAVNIIGKILGDTEKFKGVMGRRKVLIEKG